MVFHYSLSDNKFPQVSRILLSIMADLNNALVWMVSNPPLILKSTSPRTNPFVTVPSAQLVSPSLSCSIFFFNSLARSRYLSFFSLSFSFTLCLAGTAKPTIRWVLFLSLNLVVWLRLGDPFVSQNHREVCVSNFPGRILGCAFTIRSYGQILVSYSIPSGSSRSPSRVLSLALFLLTALAYYVMGRFISITT